MNKKDSDTSQEVTSAEVHQSPPKTDRIEEDFQLLNALEIFWNIDSENIELLKQNWWCKCDNCATDSSANSQQTNLAQEVDFHVYESKWNIQGDVLTIKPEYLQNILTVCKSINPDFLNGEAQDLYLFSSPNNMYKYLLNSLQAGKVQTWQDFEQQLTIIIEYKVTLLYYAVSLEY